MRAILATEIVIMPQIYIYLSNDASGIRTIQDERTEVGGMSQSTRRKPALIPVCPSQIPYGLNWVRTRLTVIRTYVMPPNLRFSIHFGGDRGRALTLAARKSG